MPMLALIKNQTYLHLFSAQVIALVGTGLLSVALGLLAYELAGQMQDLFSTRHSPSR